MKRPQQRQRATDNSSSSSSSPTTIVATTAANIIITTVIMCKRTRTAKYSVLTSQPDSLLCPPPKAKHLRPPYVQRAAQHQHARYSRRSMYIRMFSSVRRHKTGGQACKLLLSSVNHQLVGFFWCSRSSLRCGTSGICSLRSVLTGSTPASVLGAPCTRCCCLVCLRRRFVNVRGFRGTPGIVYLASYRSPTTPYSVLPIADDTSIKDESPCQLLR